MAEAVDTSLYSRQIYALGMGAMQRMRSATVAIVGCGGPAMEIAKNLILSGVEKVLLVDDSDVTWDDLQVNCFASEADIGVVPRSKVGVRGTAPLNPSVRVEAVCASNFCDVADYASLADPPFNVTVVVRCVSGISSWDVDLDKHLRARGVKFLLINSAGVFAELINDFGEDFVVSDPGGEDPSRHYVTNTQVLPDVAVEEGKCPAMRVQLTVEKPSDGDEDTLYSNFDVIFTAIDGNANQLAPLFGGESFPIVDRHVVRDSNGGGTESVVVVVELGSSEAVKASAMLHFSSYAGGIYVAAVLRPVKQCFDPVEVALDKKQFVSNFSFDDQLAHHLFRALDKFMALKGGRLPELYCSDDVQSFLSLVGEGPASQNSENRKWATVFAATAAAQLGPFAAFIGGVAAQEVLKAVTGKFIPIHQIRYFDCREVIPFSGARGEDVEFPNDVSTSPAMGKPSRNDSLIRFLGEARCKKLFDASIFLVGAGAIGCEYLKNFALLGVGSGRAGKICVTDNDSIERSNLSRQFLFRNEHIGQFKAQVATAATKAINSNLKLRCLTEKVCSETADRNDGVFNDRFWSQLTCICTAVDNNLARAFLDDAAVRHRCPMIDSGTLGPMGHVEVVIPGHRPRLRDAGHDGDGGKRIPFCTLHFFPSNINHCIEYARDLFETLFSTCAQDANKFLEADSFDTFLSTVDPGAQKGLLESLAEVLLLSRPQNTVDCVVWARRMFETLMVNPIRDTLASFPPDHIEDGKPFWGGSRKLPQAIAWDPASHPSHLDAVAAAARLRADMFNIDFSLVSREEILSQASAAEVPPYIPKKVVIKGKQTSSGGSDGGQNVEGAICGPSTRSLEQLQEQLRAFHARHRFGAADALAPLRPLLFEKDDAGNGHIDFITSFSNSRAASYAIPPEDAMFTKKVAGRIIPAMITTTAAVTGLATIQLLSVLLSPHGSEAKNYSISLQDPSLCQASEGGSPPKKRYMVPIDDVKLPRSEKVHLEGAEQDRLERAYPLLRATFTSWDRFELEVPEDLQINSVCDIFSSKYRGLHIASLVEERSAKWVFNASTDAAGHGATFPLGMWTLRLLDKVEIKGSFVIDFIVQCTLDAPLQGNFRASASLPILRYKVAPVRKRR